MAYNRFAVLSDERNDWLRPLAQCIDKICFGRPFKSGYVQFMDRNPIFFFFGSN